MQAGVAVGKIVESTSNSRSGPAGILERLTRSSPSDHPPTAGQLPVDADCEDVRHRDAAGTHTLDDGRFGMHVLGSTGLEIYASAIVETYPHDNRWTPGPQRFSFTGRSPEPVSSYRNRSAVRWRELHTATLGGPGDREPPGVERPSRRQPVYKARLPYSAVVNAEMYSLWSPSCRS